ncbi:hypothetical protein PHYC_03767 [Phycisphaerales bacterium]|nr:hypothetical protein PHYC_03767 [Phycisphaerales bacterium]
MSDIRISHQFSLASLDDFDAAFEALVHEAREFAAGE